MYSAGKGTVYHSEFGRDHVFYSNVANALNGVVSTYRQGGDRIFHAKPRISRHS